MLRILALLILRVSGWKIQGEFPGFNRCVMVIAPHTSMWDFVWGRLVCWALELEGRFMIKKEIFKPPLSWLLKAIGGIPVDRSPGNNTVTEVVDLIHKQKKIMLVITPEGTRKKVSDWKRGFYTIARQARIPIVLGCLDYSERVAYIGDSIDSSLPYPEVKARLDQFYAGHKGKHPQRFHL
jgi:1-acyl-sn-glycerol-3-phosphate acyltransferase